LAASGMAKWGDVVGRARDALRVFDVSASDLRRGGNGHVANPPKYLDGCFEQSQTGKKTRPNSPARQPPGRFVKEFAKFLRGTAKILSKNGPASSRLTTASFDFQRGRHVCGRGQSPLHTGQAKTCDGTMVIKGPDMDLGTPSCAGDVVSRFEAKGYMAGKARRSGVSDVVYDV